MQLTNLSEDFATEVKDFNINIASTSDIKKIQNLVYTRKLVVLKHQLISRDEYQNFSRKFGTLEQFKLKNYHNNDYPNILVINNNKNGKVGARKLGNMWHSDSSYLKEPLPLTFLHAQTVPNSGGDTLFIDMQRALEELPSDLRHKIDNRQAIHDVCWTYKVKEEDLGESIQEILARLSKAIPASSHPTIATHPHTHHQSLYLNPGYTTRIEGYTEEASRKLLDEIFDIVITDSRIFSYKWEPSDLVIWDNRSVLHCATPLPPNANRIMHRIGVTDGPFFSRITPKENIA